MSEKQSHYAKVDVAVDALKNMQLPVPVASTCINDILVQGLKKLDVPKSNA